MMAWETEQNEVSLVVAELRGEEYKSKSVLSKGKIVFKDMSGHGKSHRVPSHFVSLCNNGWLVKDIFRMRNWEDTDQRIAAPANASYIVVVAFLASPAGLNFHS